MTESGWKTFLGSNATSPHNPQLAPLGSFNHFHNTVNRLLVILSLIVVVAVAFAFIVIFSSVVHSPIVSFILFYYREMFSFLLSFSSSATITYFFVIGLLLLHWRHHLSQPPHLAMSKKQTWLALLPFSDCHLHSPPLSEISTNLLRKNLISRPLSKPPKITTPSSMESVPRTFTELDQNTPSSPEKSPNAQRGNTFPTAYFPLLSFFIHLQFSSCLRFSSLSPRE